MWAGNFFWLVVWSELTLFSLLTIALLKGRKRERIRQVIYRRLYEATS